MRSKKVPHPELRMRAGPGTVEGSSMRFRAYGSAITITPSKTDYSEVRATPQDKKRIALLEEYVRECDGAKGGMLCTVIHEAGRVCRKVEGHE